VEKSDDLGGFERFTLYGGRLYGMSNNAGDELIDNDCINELDCIGSRTPVFPGRTTNCLTPTF
jgi:hypothetical protein